ncbi:MAG: hypothetical protein FWF53_06475, partial [Candidatus Azobacteroides sp.]|nr:hypothetical protein [Candidatus Azobacteroides sp.]
MNTKKYLKLIPIAALLLFGIFSVKAQNPGNLSTPMELWLRADSGVTTVSNSVTDWADQSGMGRNYTGRSPVGTNVYPTFNQSTYLRNFQPSIDFRSTAYQKLVGPANFLNAGRSYYVFYVSETDLSGTFRTVYEFNSARNNNIGWLNGNPSVYIQGNGNNHQGNNGRLYGINAVFLPNSTTVRPQLYMNGVVNATNFTARILGTGSGAGVIGSSTSANNDNYLFYGNIQEIIILSGVAGNQFNPDDINKVYSYLSIKYGIPVENLNYVNSAGTVIWDRTGSTNAGYNNNIFGIGRDDAFGLNQVQSRNSETELITVFKGDALATLNDKNSDALSDKTFLMLGSDGLTANTSYVQPAGTAYADGAITTDRINTHSATYKAQITTSGASAPGGSQTVGIKIVSTSAKYVLVSADPAFPKASTRMYPITNLTATNVLINNGDYLTLAGYETSPGGLDLGAGGYTLDLWVDGDHSTDISWNNIEAANFNLEKFSTYAPIVRNSAFNFHKELFFGNAASSKLRTTANYPIASGNGYYVFAVSDSRAAFTTAATIFTFNNS